MRRLAPTLPALAFAGVAHAAETTDAGSIFVYPTIAKWAADYQAKTSNRVDYQSAGSGAGLSAIKNATVDVGASDVPMKADELQKLGLGQRPLVVGGLVPVVNIEGIKTGELRFSGPILADVFLSKIKTWNDTALQALNPDMRLPTVPITVAHRADSRGQRSAGPIICRKSALNGPPLSSSSCINSPRIWSVQRSAVDFFRRSLESGQKQAQSLD